MTGYWDIFMRALPPHGYCLLWYPQLVWTHVIADALIAVAYFSIPVALVTFVRRRRDLEFGFVFWLFAAFITLCGATHVMAIWTLWHGDYGLEGVLKAITALASVVTAVMLWPLLPRALSLPSAAQLRAANTDLAAALEALRAETAERLKVEDALVHAQKMEAVGQLTGGIAHDFNNLLQAVSGNVELIARHGQDDPRIARWSANAAASLERGRALTAQLLAFSRQQKLELKAVALRPAIVQAVDMLRHTLGPQISVQCGPDDDWHVIADPTQLELSILNLGINARDALPDGGVIRITTTLITLGEERDGMLPGRYVDLTVTDNGQGMSAQVRERAFEPFFTTKDMDRGTGLGLSMVFGTARQSGGTAFLESEEGRGTSVTIRLRVTDPPVEYRPETPVAVNDGASAWTDRLDGLSVLLVDDDEAVRIALSEAMAAHGAHVVEADGGPRAIALLAQSLPDIVVLDFAMPGMNGAVVAAHIAEAYPGLPTLVASGYADTAALEAAMGPEMRMLRKPFTHAELIAAIRATMADKDR